MSEIDENLEVRKKPVLDYAQNVPNVILDAVRTVGKENLILDLTVGKKDITGSLYTSACIAQITNMVYVDVKRDQEGKFFKINQSDKDICEKVSVTQFQTISEIERLASLNYMDFVIYKKLVEEFVPSAPSRFHVLLDAAINSYFSKEKNGFADSIRSVGLINEDLLPLIINYFRSDRTFSQLLTRLVQKVRRFIEAQGGEVIMAGGDNLLVRMNKRILQVVCEKVGQSETDELHFSVGFGANAPSAYLALKYAKTMRTRYASYFGHLVCGDTLCRTGEIFSTSKTAL